MSGTNPTRGRNAQQTSKIANRVSKSRLKIHPIRPRNGQDLRVCRWFICQQQRFEFPAGIWDNFSKWNDEIGRVRNQRQSGSLELNQKQASDPKRARIRDLWHGRRCWHGNRNRNDIADDYRSVDITNDPNYCLYRLIFAIRMPSQARNDKGETLNDWHHGIAAIIRVPWAIWDSVDQRPRQPSRRDDQIQSEQGIGAIHRDKYPSSPNRRMGSTGLMSNRWQDGIELILQRQWWMRRIFLLFYVRICCPFQSRKEELPVLQHQLPLDIGIMAAEGFGSDSGA